MILGNRFNRLFKVQTPVIPCFWNSSMIMLIHSDSSNTSTHPMCMCVCVCGCVCLPQVKEDDDHKVGGVHRCVENWKLISSQNLPTHLSPDHAKPQTHACSWLFAKVSWMKRTPVHKNNTKKSIDNCWATVKEGSVSVFCTQLLHKLNVNFTDL